MCEREAARPEEQGASRDPAMVTRGGCGRRARPTIRTISLDLRISDATARQPPGTRLDGSLLDPELFA